MQRRTKTATDNDPMQLAYRSPVRNCLRLASVPNEAAYLIHVLSCRLRWSHETVPVSGDCVVHRQPAMTVFTATAITYRFAAPHPGHFD